MKRLVIIVPDTIMHSVSNFNEIRRREIPVTGQGIVKALEFDEYDENYFFPAGSVRVVSVEDCISKQAG